MKLPWFRRHFLLRRQLDRLFLDLPDALFRRLTGRGDWPPYSLRSFVGGAHNFDRVGHAFLDEFWRLGLLHRGTRILDVGCGCGRIARALAADPRLQDLDVRYTGMDIDSASVAWCQRHITPVHPTYTFYQADCSNQSYNPHGATSAGAYVFPHHNASFDLILLTSVLTHLLEPDLCQYLAEVSRMLAPGGVAYVSFFLYQSTREAVAGAVRHGIRFPFAEQNYAVHRQDYPANAVAYDEAFVRRTTASLGLEIAAPTRYGIQDVLLLSKAPDTRQAELGPGWHDLENGCWRWTERAFAVHLRRASPELSTLRFRFHLAAATIDKHRRIQLQARTAAAPLPWSAYSTPGEQLFVCTIPAHLWTDSSILIYFELDNALAPSPADARELGLQVAFARCSGPLQHRLEPFLLTR